MAASEKSLRLCRNLLMFVNHICKTPVKQKFSWIFNFFFKSGTTDSSAILELRKVCYSIHLNQISLSSLLVRQKTETVSAVQPSTGYSGGRKPDFYSLKRGLGRKQLLSWKLSPLWKMNTDWTNGSEFTRSCSLQEVSLLDNCHTLSKTMAAAQPPQ